MVRKATYVHIVAVLGLTAILAAVGAPHQWVSCLGAGALAGVNLALLTWTMQKIFQKKSIALAISVIVIKYAALLGILIYLNALGWHLDFGFALGLASVFPTLGFVAYQHMKQSETDGSL